MDNTKRSVGSESRTWLFLKNELARVDFTAEEANRFLGFNLYNLDRRIHANAAQRNPPLRIAAEHGFKLRELIDRTPEEIWNDGEILVRWCWYSNSPAYYGPHCTASENLLEKWGLVPVIPRSFEQDAGDWERTETIAEALLSLPQRQELVIRYRFFEGMTLEVVGQKLGVTRERIRDIEAKALARLRTPYPRYHRLRMIAQKQ